MGKPSSKSHSNCHSKSHSTTKSKSEKKSSKSKKSNKKKIFAVSIEDNYEIKQNLLRKYLKYNDKIDVEKSLSKNDKFILTQINFNRFKMVERFLYLFGCLYFVLGLVALIFYKYKTALCLVGLTSIIHMFKNFILKFFKVTFKTNTSLTNLIINLFWLIVCLSVIIYYLSKDKNQLDKKEFDDEIILHVGLLFYGPITIISSYYSFKMFQNNIEFSEIYV